MNHDTLNVSSMYLIDASSVKQYTKNERRGLSRRGVIKPVVKSVRFLGGGGGGVVFIYHGTMVLTLGILPLITFLVWDLCELRDLNDLYCSNFIFAFFVFYTPEALISHWCSRLNLSYQRNRSYV